MSIRNLDINHDWTFGSGKSNYLIEQKEIELNLKTRLYSFFGDWFLDTDFGIDYWNLLDYKGIDKLENQIQNTIINTPGITEVESVDVTIGANRTLQTSYKAKTIFSQSIEGLIPLNVMV